MDSIPFYKMSGSGNDFIVIDNRQRVVGEANRPDFIQKICRRQMSAGADGLILLEAAPHADFKWHFYNADGGRAEMCGNGARCAARFAFLNQMAGEEMTFETDAGIIHATMQGDRVRIRMTDPSDMALDYSLALEKETLNVSSVNTGVPHVVVVVEDLEGIDVPSLGREIRFHGSFAPAGTNANFVAVDPSGGLAVRTYERGVEDETLACGTGSVAAALVMARQHGVTSPVRILTRSGQYLWIHFAYEGEVFSDVYLEGDARIVYRGEMCEEAWTY